MNAIDVGLNAIELAGLNAIENAGLNAIGLAVTVHIIHKAPPARVAPIHAIGIVAIMQAAWSATGDAMCHHMCTRA